MTVSPVSLVDVDSDCQPGQEDQQGERAHQVKKKCNEIHCKTIVSPR